MATSLKYGRFASVSQSAILTKRATLRYWLLWAVLVAVLALGINAYFDFRNRELDKRIEQINKGYRPGDP